MLSRTHVTGGQCATTLMVSPSRPAPSPEDLPTARFHPHNTLATLRARPRPCLSHPKCQHQAWTAPAPPPPLPMVDRRLPTSLYSVTHKSQADLQGQCAVEAPALRGTSGCHKTLIVPAFQEGPQEKI